MFVPIAIDDFVKNFVKNNPKEDPVKIKTALVRAVEAKKSGTV